MPRNNTFHRHDVKEALKHYGKVCLKCGFDLLIEVHHVYGTHDRRIEHLQPLCKWCHQVAPMGDKYWEWLETGATGQDSIHKRLQAIIAGCTEDEIMEAISGFKLSKGYATRRGKRWNATQITRVLQ